MKNKFHTPTNLITFAIAKDFTKKNKIPILIAGYTQN